eukprot:TRINITY_DN5679_c0_g1_i1.p1 TRINITY_DN5679_c0_g1~~TRINITY_DN5679_c0_g1_i1.p1  ORF type:complete len:638 (+),score=185.16 TRINITY_DN5679_c0_g1_i1:84-1997(+)
MKKQKFKLSTNLEMSIPSTSSIVAGEEMAQTILNKIAPEGKLDLYELKIGLLDASEKLGERGLYQSAKFVSEFLYDTLKDLSITKTQYQKYQNEKKTQYPVIETKENLQNVSDEDQQFNEKSTLSFGKSLFDNKEYFRCWNTLKDCTSQLGFFLASYALYLAGESIKQNNSQQNMQNPNTSSTVDPKSGQSKALNPHLNQLRSRFEQHQKQLDAFNLYLYGVVLRELNLPQYTKKLIKAILKFPYLWTAWRELTKDDLSPSDFFQLTCSPQETDKKEKKDTFIEEKKDKDQDQKLTFKKSLPDHFFKLIFIAHHCLQIQDNDSALIYLNHVENLLPNSKFVSTQISIAHYNLRDFDDSETLFEKIRKKDPFLIDSMDIYSNILYVKDQKAKLSYLAHHFLLTDAFRPETNCIIGNYYSLKGDHLKAVTYFQRALKLDSHFLSAWTLMGHEYIELSNPQAAIYCYRKAVDLNFRDYRAFYSLGQAYELLKMPSYAIHYYNKATQLRPFDSRMHIATATCYESLNKKQHAIRCYLKAESNNDREGIALNKIASLYSELGEEDTAAYYYNKIREKREMENVNGVDTMNALLFLANYCFKKNRLAESEEFCQKLLEYNGPAREEAKMLLKSITEFNKKSKN